MSWASPLGEDGETLGPGGGTHCRPSFKGWARRTVTATHLNVSMATPGKLGDRCPGHVPQDRSPLCPLDNIAVSSDGELPPRIANLAFGFAKAQAGAGSIPGA